jgi:plastocyanin
MAKPLFSPCKGEGTVRLPAVLSTLAILAAAVPSSAATLSFQVSDGNGQPLSDAVVTLAPESGEAGGGKSQPRDHFIDQKDETFIPAVEVVAVGDQVIFRNSDRTRHHVYSFSPLATFEYVLKPGETSAPVRMQKAGVVAVGCNIHDFMLNYLFVTDSRWSAKSDANGSAAIAELPAGAYVARLWHPRLRPGTVQPPQKVTVGAEGASVAVSLPALPDRRDDNERNRY